MDKTLKLLLQDSSDIVFILTKDLTITASSKVASALCKYTASTIINKDFFTVFPSQKLAPPFTKDQLATAITKKITSTTQECNSRNTIRWTAQPLQRNESILLRGKDTSITKGEIRSYLTNILDCIPVIIYCKDLEGHYLWCNQFMLDFLGINSLSAIVGKTDTNIWPQCARKLQQSDRQVIKEGRTVFIDEMSVSHNEAEIYCTGMKMPLRNENAKIVGVIGTALNITHLKHIEAELREAKDKTEWANEANNEKNKFISNMEHDLRTPCIGILQTINFLESAKKVKIPPTVKKALTYIAQTANQLLELLDDVLYFSRMKSNTLPITSKTFDIKKITNDIVALEAPLAKEKNIQLTGNCDPQIPSTIVSDKHRVQRILINLISNAVKFTEHGSVKVTLKIAKHIDQENLLLSLSVKDTGIGIHKDKQEAIYERFVRAVPQESTEKFKGSGLGLSIVKQFIHELAGEISLKSRCGKGTEFICLLPVQIPSPEELLLNTNTFSDSSLTANLDDDNDGNNGDLFATDSHEKKPTTSFANNSKLSFTAQKQNPLLQPYSQRDLKILLIEDNNLIQQVTKIMLSNITKKLDTVDTGKRAITLIKNNSYDLVFIDIDLPDTDGYHVAKNIRTFNTTIPLIALTAYTATTIKNRSLASGINDFLSKPLNNEKMLYIINKWVKPQISKDVTSNNSIATPIAVTTTPATSTIHDNEIINLKIGAQFVGNDRDKALELIRMMLRSFDAKHQKLEIAYTNKNWRQLEKIMHQLRGSIVYCGTPNLQITSAQLHGYLTTKSHKENSIIEKLYQQFTDEIEKIRATIQ